MTEKRAQDILNLRSLTRAQVIMTRLKTLAQVKKTPNNRVALHQAAWVVRIAVGK